MKKNYKALKIATEKKLQNYSKLENFSVTLI